MRISVVIPTYNRSEKLRECLEALATQDFDKKQYEVVVIDDGSQDETQELLKKIEKKFPVPLRILTQNNSGQGVARNKGIDEATGDIILFLGDDIVATPTLLREHEKLHRWYPQEHAAVLGFITWHPKLSITPLMQFMERGGAIFGRFGGHQFAFDLLQGKSMADYRFFYTSNISLKRTLLKQHKFDPWFSGYGWEDIELGYRLSKRANLQLYYNKDAIAYHDHAMNADQWADRMRAIGRASQAIHKKYPELETFPSKNKQKIFRTISHPFLLSCFKHLNQNFYFYGLSKKYFLEGLKENDKREKI